MSRLQSGLLALAIQVAVGAAAVAVRAAPVAGPHPSLPDGDAEFASTLSAAGSARSPGGDAMGAPSDDADSLDDAQAVDDTDLKAERGGFISAGGVTFDIGATVQTTVNGTLALVNTLNLSSNGQLQQSTWVNPALANATVITPSNISAISKATGINLSGVSGASGVVIPGSQGGYTAVLANLTQSALQNLVVNTANGQTITQTTNMTLTLPGFAATQAQAARANVFAGLTAALNMAQLGAR